MSSSHKIPARQDEINWLFREYLDEPKTQNAAHGGASANRGDTASRNAGEVIELLCRNADRRAIFEGSNLDYASDSEADGRLFSNLAFFCERDTALMNEVAERSGRARPKWREKRGHTTWLGWELDKAADRQAETIDPKSVHIKRNGDRRPSPRGGDSKPEGKPQPQRPFPEMDEAAYGGVFGRLVETISPHTEADPVALLLGALTAFGSAYGRRGYVDVSGSKHHPNLFVGIVGDTARARKGTSWAPIENIFGEADPAWRSDRITGGLSSGEGLINAVRDKVEALDEDGEVKIQDPGVRDKRLLVSEGELSQGLKVLRREGNTLSPILRNAWDGKDLSTLVRHNPLKASGPHISVLGHITSTELLRHLVESETANGFGNRFLWAVVRRSKKLPFGGELSTVDMSPLAGELRDALRHSAGRMKFADDARETWVEMYDALTEERPGMFGEVTARAEAQTLRLAIVYALADRSSELRAGHLASAFAVWNFCEDSALYLFGDQIGDADADKLLEALRQSEDGMTRTEIRDLFGRNKNAGELQRILDLLKDTGKARATREREADGKKPVERWHAAGDDADAEGIMS